MTAIKQIEYVGTFPELLDKSCNEDPTATKADVFQLPNTHELQERFAMTFSGPESRQLAGMMTMFLDSLAAKARKPAPTS
jgi:hypothetical protein